MKNFNFTLIAALSLTCIACSDSDSLTIPITETTLIEYISTDSQIITPTSVNGFGARLVSNTYTEGLGTMSFSSAVTAIGERAFWNCTTLQAIKIPLRVRAINDSAFAGCENLETITIPASVMDIGNGAFAYCNNLELFNGKFSTLDGRCLIIGRKLVAFAPDGLATYNIPDGVIEIAGGAFEGCQSLASVGIPTTVSDIDERAFAYCLSLDNITVPSGVTELDASTFEGCTTLATVILPATLKEIDTRVFAGCTALTSIYCRATTPPEIATGTFDDISAEAKIFVPTASLSAYQTAPNWDNYSTQIQGYEFE
jgi:hypothetical protein